MDPAPTLLILSFSPIGQDARVLKQVRHFSKHYTVTTCGYGPAPDGAVRHIEIPEGLQVWQYDRLALIARQYRRAYWRNAAVSHAAAQLRNTAFDVVLANDVDAVPLALSLKARFGVHADLHEYAPRQKEELRRWRWFVAPVMRWLCRQYVRNAASVTTVSDGLAREYEREFGIRADVVTNATPYADLRPGATKIPVRLVHSGACFRNRNLLTMIDAVAAAAAPVTLDLYLTPNDPVYLHELRARADEVDGVTVNAAVPYERLIETLNAFDVGLFILRPVNFNYTWALPNKLFDYVQARLGVVIGPSAEMAKYVEGYSLGVVVDDFSTSALTSVLDRLTPERVAEMKRNADAAARPLSADAQVQIWGDAVRQLMSAPETSAPVTSARASNSTTRSADRPSP